MAARGAAEPDKWLDQLAEWVGVIDAEFARYILALREWIGLCPEDAFPPISRCGLEPDYQDHRAGISPFVVGSVLWSLYSFFRSPDDYLETVQTAIAVGGDVDTTAAMAGAISGAYLGIRAVPTELASRVTDQGTWRYADLVDLAHRCHRIKCEESNE